MRSEDFVRTKIFVRTFFIVKHSIYTNLNNIHVYISYSDLFLWA